MSEGSALRAAFRIGDMFPADDLVARFLTGVAMSTNDLMRVQSYVVVEQEVWASSCSCSGRTPRICGRRRSSCATAVGSQPSRNSWLRCPSALGSTSSGRWRGSCRPGQTDFGREVAFIRNHAFHYPELRGVGDPLSRALDQVADTEGAISGAIVRDFKFDFADEVAGQLLS